MTSKSLLKMRIEELIPLKNEYDNALRNIEMLRNKKNQIEEEVNRIINNLNMEGKTIIVNNQKISQKRITVSQSLTFKYIEQVLEKYNQHYSPKERQLNTKELLKFIKNSRPKTMKTEIKID